MMGLNDQETEQGIKFLIETIQNEIKSKEEELEELNGEIMNLEKESDEVNMQKEEIAVAQNFSKDLSDSWIIKISEKTQEAVTLSKENNCFQKKLEEEAKLIRAIKSDWSKHVDTFVNEMQEISAVYCEAVDFYTSHSLQEALETVTSGFLNAKNDIKISEDDLTKVQDEMQGDSGSLHPPHEMEIPLEQRRLILKMLEDDCISSENGLEALMEGKKKVLSDIEEIEKELAKEQHML